MEDNTLNSEQLEEVKEFTARLLDDVNQEYEIITTGRDNIIANGIEKEIRYQNSRKERGYDFLNYDKVAEDITKRISDRENELKSDKAFLGKLYRILSRGKLPNKTGQLFIYEYFALKKELPLFYAGCEKIYEVCEENAYPLHVGNTELWFDMYFEMFMEDNLSDEDVAIFKFLAKVYHELKELDLDSFEYFSSFVMTSIYDWFLKLRPLKELTPETWRCKKQYENLPDIRKMFKDGAIDTRVCLLNPTTKSEILHGLEAFRQECTSYINENRMNCYIRDLLLELETIRYEFPDEPLTEDREALSKNVKKVLDTVFKKRFSHLKKWSELHDHYKT